MITRLKIAIGTYQISGSGGGNESSVSYIFKVAAWWKSNYKDVMSKLKVLVATYQVSGAVSGTLSVKLPANFTSFLAAVSFMNLNLSALVPVGCTAKYTFIDKLYLVTMVPFGVSLMLALAFFVDYGFVRRRIQANKQRRRGEKSRAFNEIKTKYLNYFFYLTYLVLPSVTTTIFQIFLCTNVDPNNEDSNSDDLFLTADMNISCTSDYYYEGVAFACLMILMYPIGTPLMYFVLLYSNKEEIMGRDAGYSGWRYTEDPRLSEDTVVNPMSDGYDLDNGDVELADFKQIGPPRHSLSGARPSIGDVDAPRGSEAMETGISPQAQQISFLWDAFLPKYWYWEIVETTRRLVLTAVLSVCGPGSSSQAVLAVLVSLAYIKLYGHYAPYCSLKNNRLAEVGQFQIFFTFFGGLVLENNLIESAFRDHIGFLLILINLSVAWLFCYYTILSGSGGDEDEGSASESSPLDDGTVIESDSEGENLLQSLVLTGKLNDDVILNHLFMSGKLHGGGDAASLRRRSATKGEAQ